MQEHTAHAGAVSGGRITQDDVKEFAKRVMHCIGGNGQAAAAAGGAAARNVVVTPLPDFTKWGEVERKAMSGIRRKTAENLSHAWNTIPHVTQFDKADITNLEAMRKKYGPIYAAGKIPAGSYPGQDRENQTINVWGVLFVHETMSEQLAYNILKTFFDRHQDLVNAHREAANMTVENQTIGASAVPWHPGAVKYFAERGIKVK